MPRIVRPIDRVVYTREMKVYALAIWLDTRNMELTCRMFKEYYGRRLSKATLATWKHFCLAPHSGAKCQIHAHNTRSRYLNNSDTDINYIYIPTNCGTSLFKIVPLYGIFLA